jgi:hypothetical protein
MSPAERRLVWSRKRRAWERWAVVAVAVFIGWADYPE